jgi:hypothetical protein
MMYLMNEYEIMLQHVKSHGFMQKSPPFHQVQGIFMPYLSTPRAPATCQRKVYFADKLGQNLEYIRCSMHHSTAFFMLIPNHIMFAALPPRLPGQNWKSMQARVILVGLTFGLNFGTNGGEARSKR